MPYKDIEIRRERQRKKYLWDKENNPEKLREKDRKKRKNNPEKYREKSIRSYHKNKEKNREKKNERDRKRYNDNKVYHRKRIEENIKKRKEENPEKFREVYSKWERDRRNNDHMYRVKKNLSRRMRDFLKGKGKVKSQTTLSIIGLTYEGLREHIEGQWEPWMNWNNYGLYKKDTFNFGWDIDHIIPTSTATTEEELYRLNHYTNLKPLCSKVNRDIKRDII